jgi:hypothetical protein
MLVRCYKKTNLYIMDLGLLRPIREKYDITIDKQSMMDI